MDGDFSPWGDVGNERREFASGPRLCRAGGVGCPLQLCLQVSRPHKVPCGDAAISMMQIAHFLDFVSMDLDKGGEQGQTACTI